MLIPYFASGEAETQWGLENYLSPGSEGGRVSLEIRVAVLDEDRIWMCAAPQVLFNVWCPKGLGLPLCAPLVATAIEAMWSCLVAPGLGRPIPHLPQGWNCPS